MIQSEEVLSSRLLYAVAQGFCGFVFSIITYDDCCCIISTTMADNVFYIVHDTILKMRQYLLEPFIAFWILAIVFFQMLKFLNKTCRQL